MGSKWGLKGVKMDGQNGSKRGPAVASDNGQYRQYWGLESNQHKVQMGSLKGVIQRGLAGAQNEGCQAGTSTYCSMPR